MAAGVPPGVPSYLIADGETVLRVAQPTRIVLIPLILIAVLVTALAIVLWYNSGAPAALYAGFLIDTVLFFFIGKEAVRLATSEYVLTDRRIIKQTGILNRSSVDSWLEKVNNVEHRQTIWGRILGFGDVVVDTASETGSTVFPSINAPIEFKRAIIDAVQRYRERFTQAPAGYAPASVAPSPAQRLRELKSLLDDGLISAEEYETARRRALEQL